MASIKTMCNLHGVHFRRFYGFKRAVEKLVMEGNLEMNVSREYTVNFLAELETGLLSGYSSSWFPFSSRQVKGAYIYGRVGSGKTMIMDLFYENVNIIEKNRFHYNQFMLQFHSGLREIRNIGNQDPLKELIKRYCKATKLLCLDEFQVLK